MGKALWYFSLRTALLFLYILLAQFKALPAQAQFPHEIVTEMNTMKQHMAAQQQQIMAQQHLMTALQQEIKTQKQQSMEQMTAQQHQITALQQQTKTQNHKLIEQAIQLMQQKQQLAGQHQQIATQQQHVTALQQQMQSQKQLLTEQRHELTEQKQHLTAQQQQIGALQDQMKAQKQLLTEQSRALTEQKKQQTAQHRQIITLRTTKPVDKHMTRRLLEDDIVTEVGTLKQQMAAAQAAQQKQGLLVAANAHLKLSFSPGPNQRIIYDDVTMNHGNAYSMVQGTFSAPYAGTYLFSVSQCSYAGRYIDLELMHDDLSVKHFLAGDTAWNDCSSGTALLDLQSGDAVWVRHRGTGSCYVYTTTYQRGVSFTGFLLHAS